MVQILDVDGNVVFTFAINRQGDDTSTLNIGNVSPGVYEFRATLYSLENAGGVVMGVTSQVVDLCGKSVNVRTTRQFPPTKIKMSPQVMDITEQQSKRFIATAIAANGDSVFVAEDAFTWSVLGGIGSATGWRKMRARCARSLSPLRPTCWTIPERPKKRT